MILRFDVQAYLDRPEGQHFDRKSMWEGRPDNKRPRDRRAVRDQIAEYMAGFANAEGEGGLLGVEDDRDLHSFMKCGLWVTGTVEDTTMITSTGDEDGS